MATKKVRFEGPFKNGDGERGDIVSDAQGNFIATTRSPYERRDKTLKRDVKDAVELAAFLSRVYAETTLRF